MGLADPNLDPLEEQPMRLTTESCITPAQLKTLLLQNFTLWLEMATQQIRALPAIPEDQGAVPRTHMAVHTCSENFVFVLIPDMGYRAVSDCPEQLICLML